MRHKACGTVITPVLACPECGESVAARDVEALGRAARDARAGRRRPATGGRGCRAQLLAQTWHEVGTKVRSDVGVHLHHMSRRTQIMLTDRQHAFLSERVRAHRSLAR